MEQFIVEGYKKKLVNKLYALMCERETEGEWEKFRDSIFIELMGQEALLESISYWELLGKLGALKYLSWFWFRKTIFECISIVQGRKT